jgi:hypothetical protein
VTITIQCTECNWQQDFCVPSPAFGVIQIAHEAVQRERHCRFRNGDLRVVGCDATPGLQPSVTVAAEQTPCAVPGPDGAWGRAIGVRDGVVEVELSCGKDVGQ